MISVGRDVIDDCMSGGVWSMYWRSCRLCAPDQRSTCLDLCWNVFTWYLEYAYDKISDICALVTLLPAASDKRLVYYQIFPLCVKGSYMTVLAYKDGLLQPM